MIKIKGNKTTAKIFTNNVEQAAKQQVQEMVDHEITEKTQVRVMPDIHAGKGSTIGTTISLPADFEDWKVSPNVVGVDIGCFTGDTKVQLTDGRSLSFLELIEEYDKGIENYVYGIDNGEVSISKLHAPRKTNTVTELAYITLDNGRVIKCTVDHKFILRNGKAVEAKDLTKGLSLMPLYIEKAGNVESNLRDYTLSSITENMKEYHAVYMPNKGDYVMAHVLADNYNYKNNPGLEGKIYENGTKSFVRHHIDFNKYNNNPNNIERVGFKEHWKIHAESVTKTNKLGITGFAKAIELDPSLPSRAGKKRANSTWNGPNAKRNYEKKAKLMKEMNDSGIVNSKKHREDSRIRQLKNNTNKFHEKNKDPNFIKLQRKSRYKRIAEICMSNYGAINEENWSKTRVTMAKNTPTYTSFLNMLSEYSMTKKKLLETETTKKNHKVINVEIKTVEPIDVYCLTNFSHGNFALSAGVFVNNCGIAMYNLGRDEIDLERLDDTINSLVPAGFSVHGQRQDSKFTEEVLANLTFKVSKRYINRLHLSLGTLGGGNHFIELGVDEEGNHWLAVHSGSRNLGVQVAKHHQKIAINNLKANRVDIDKIINGLKEEGRHKEIESTIKNFKKNNKQLTNRDKELAYLTNDELKDYLSDMTLTQEFAKKSREKMLDIIVEAMNLTVVDKFDSTHNFIDHDNYTNGTIRKGATSANKGERLVIPLNMRDGSLICKGKGNEDWNNSAPHGAGRMMSRKVAKESIKFEDFENQMKDIYSSSITLDTIDEAPEAYKPAEEILANIGPTAEVLHLVKPIYNFKAH